MNVFQILPEKDDFSLWGGGGGESTSRLTLAGGERCLLRGRRKNVVPSKGKKKDKACLVSEIENQERGGIILAHLS